MAWCEFRIVAVAGHAADYMACINLDEATWVYPHADGPMKTNIDLPRHVVTVQGRYADVAALSYWCYICQTWAVAVAHAGTGVGAFLSPKWVRKTKLLANLTNKRIQSNNKQYLESTGIVQ